MPTYDILKPDRTKVKIIRFNEDKTVVVSGEFIVWVTALKQEIERLREKTGEIWD